MRVLLADDESSIRKGIAAFLKSKSHAVHEASNGFEAFELYKNGFFDVVITDLKMPQMSGFELLGKIRETDKIIPVIIMTAFASVEDAVSAMKSGASDYLTKPLNLEELRIKLGLVEKQLVLMHENEALKNRLHGLEFPEMIGQSPPMQRIKALIAQVSADSDIPVLISGESGTGKELAARAVHKTGERREHPFIAVNCAAFPENLLESELFGFKKGAFTGAYKDKPGFFQAAHLGTLFLDEISEMPKVMQAKLLRVLQSSQVQPLGSTEPVNINVRVISASNQNLSDLIAQGAFREDLYFRLNVIEIRLPPLRERKTDIDALIVHFAEKFPAPSGPLRMSPQAMDALRSYSWPGNIRELENCIRRLSVTAENGLVRLSDMPEEFIRIKMPISRESALHSMPYKEALQKSVEAFEKAYLDFHLVKYKGNISKTAEAIGLSRVALHKKINQYGLNPAGHCK